MALRKLLAGIVAYVMIFLPAYPVMADAPLFWPSERDYSSNSGYRIDTPPCMVDLDSDGDLDIAVGYESSETIRLFENQGDGTYVMKKEIAANDISRGSSIVAADLDGDGDADLAAGTRSGVEILINGGGWNLTSKGVYATKAWVAAGDLDGDGDVDLVTDGVTVLLNNGDATFTSGGHYEAMGSVTVADFTGDGRPDIATSGQGSWWSGTDGSLLVNDGAGGFLPGSSLGARGYYATQGDLDLDGDEDIILASWSGSTVLMNNGSGSFTAGESLNVDFEHVTVGDFSGDGIPDLVGYHRTEVHVLIGRGDGIFSGSIQGYFGCGSAYVAQGDVDNDGDLDVILAETDGCGEIGVIMNFGDGTLADDPSITDAVLGFSPGSVTIADFNGDGRNDIAAGSWRSRELRILFNSGKGDFTPGPLVDVTDATSLVAADFDNDGDMDLATSGIDILLNDGKGSFTLSSQIDARGGFLAAADLDKDGDVDIVTGYVSVLLNNGNGSFAPPIEYAGAGEGNSYSGGELVLGDFNGDQFPDVAVTTSRSHIILSLNDGYGGFTQSTKYTAAVRDQSSGLYEESYGIAIGDVDRDGDLDIATSVRYWRSGAYGSGSKLRIFENNGAGKLAEPKTYDMLNGMNADAYGIESGDFNGDGLVDFAIVTCYHSVAIAINQGDGTFVNGGNYSGVCGEHYMDEIAGGDLNGDGITDLLVIEGVGMDGIRVLLSNRKCENRVPALMKLTKEIVGKIDIQLRKGITDKGLRGIASDIASLESEITSLMKSGCVEKGQGQAMLAKVRAAAASADRAALEMKRGKKGTAGNMLEAGSNQLTALLHFLAAKQ